MVDEPAAGSGAPPAAGPGTLVAFVGVVFAVAAVGAQFPPGEWYAGLERPSWNPPNWLFAPVWTVLYALIAVSGWLVVRRAGLARAAPALIPYGVQLVLNGAWSWLFFGLERPGLALADILALLAAIAVTVALFWRIRPLAGALLVPYLLWVGFAAALNWQIWVLNR